MTSSTTKRRASRYLLDAVEPTQIRRVVTEAVKQLRARADEFDGIAVKGLSGLLIGPIVALRLRRPLIAVRDVTVPTHADCKVEAGITSGRYVILDDITRSGHTVETIIDQLATVHPQLRPVGLYLYREDTWFADDYTIPGALPLWSRTAKMKYENGVARVIRYLDTQKAA